MVSNDTRLDMTVTIIIVTVDLRAARMHRIDRAIKSERSIAKFTAMHDFELHGRFK